MGKKKQEKPGKESVERFAPLAEVLEARAGIEPIYFDGFAYEIRGTATLNERKFAYHLVREEDCDGVKSREIVFVNPKRSPSGKRLKKQTKYVESVAILLNEWDGRLQAGVATPGIKIRAMHDRKADNEAAHAAEAKKAEQAAAAEPAAPTAVPKKKAPAKSAAKKPPAKKAVS